MTPGDPALLARLGVTRLAEQGSLDRLGVAVWAAIRPAARSLVVTNGKGYDDDDARRSAVMEAFESACAEDWERLCVHRATPAEIIEAGLDPLPLGPFLKCLDPTLDPARPRRWVVGKRGTAEVRVPYEMVGLDATADAEWDHRAFAMSSVGLAAHPDPSRAESAALLEVIEHDARAIAAAVPGRSARCPRLDPSKTLTEDGQRIARRATALGVGLELIDLTTDIGIPTILAILTEMVGDAARVRRHAGAACRGTVAAAAEAALLEAAQSRVTHIAGSRDDIAPESFRPYPESPLRGATPFAPRADCVSEPAIPDSGTIHAHLRRAGIGTPVFVDLAWPGAPAHCIAALVPDLELAGTPERPARHGPRMARAAIRQLIA